MCTNLDVLMKNSLRYNVKKPENGMNEERKMMNEALYLRKAFE